MGVATKKLLVLHNSTKMYLYGDFDAGICFMSIEMSVNVGVLMS